MFPTIDAVIGMMFVYLLLSLICSSIREAAESLTMKRSAALKAGLDRLVGAETARKLCQHPLVVALFDHPSGPAYIPPRTFSAALLDLMRDDANLPSQLRQALRTLESGAQNDEARFRAAIENWFNSAMDSVSRAYRRHTHAWLAVIGLGAAIALNADSIRMTSALFDNAALRLGMPIGWSGVTPDNTLPWKEPWAGPWWNNARLLFQWHWAGWLCTVAAINLGAPFWFDLLKRVLPARTP